MKTFALALAILPLVNDVAWAAMNGSLVILSAPSLVNPGATFSATFQLTNTGTSTFPSGGENPVRIASRSPQDNYIWGIQRINLPADLLAGQSVTISATFTAPSTSATYPFAWQPVQEHISWFGSEVSQSIQVGTVITPLPPRLPSQTGYVAGYPIFSQAPPARSDTTLVSFLTLNTGPYQADGTIHNLTWTNNSGRALQVYKVYLWSGMDIGGKGDVHIQVNRASDDSYLGALQWDHYADPTAPQQGQQFDYSVPMVIAAGDGLNIMHFANGLSPGLHAHHWLILWVK